MTPRRGPLAACFLLLLGPVGCEGQTHILDLSDLGDGWKVVIATGASDQPVFVSEPLRLQSGRVSGPELGETIPAEARLHVLELAESVERASQGRVEDFHIEAAAPPEHRRHELEGTQLTEAGPFEEGSRVLEPGPDGALIPSTAERSFELRAHILQTRRIETEPCAPPLGAFTALTAGRLFPSPAGIVDFHRPAPDTILAMGPGAIAVVRNGEVPPPKPQPSRLVGTDLGVADVLLDELLPLEGAGYLLFGHVGQRGYVWKIELGPEGLSAALVAEAPASTSFTEAGWWQGQVWAVDGFGGLWRSPPSGDAWTKVMAERTPHWDHNPLVVRGTEVVYSVHGFIHAFGTSPRPELEFRPDGGRSSNVHRLAVDPDGGLWMGYEEGDLGTLVDDKTIQWMGDMPARLLRCAPDLDLSAPHFVDKPVSIAFVGGFVVNAFRTCALMRAVRRRDGCQGLIDLEPWLDSGHPVVLKASFGELVVATTDARFLAAPIEGD